MKKIVLVLLCFSVGTIAQNRILKEANEQYTALAYAKASKNYEVYLDKNNAPDAETIRKAGNSFYFLDKPYKALNYYEQLYNILGKNISDLYYLRYIQCLRMVRDYHKAEEHTKNFYARKKDTTLINRYMKQKRLLDSLQQKPSLYTINNLKVNSKNADFGGTFYGNQLVFSSSKKNSDFERSYAWNNQPFLNLYVADRNGSTGALFNERLLFSDYLPSRFHDATVTFSPSLDTMYFTRNRIKNKRRIFKNEEGTSTLEIIRAVLSDEKIIEQKSLFFNEKEYSYGHPALSSDGKWLFFVSDKPGGYGETDIYVVQVFKDGSMNTPKNLGGVINTEGREMFPFMQDSTLYFASEGHYGLGGLDVFKSKMKKDLSFTTPKNLGKPINSNRDDFGYIVDSLDAQGYFSSNRLNGKGDDDLYAFTKTVPPCDEWVKGRVKDSLAGTPISAAKVIIYDQFEDVLTKTKTDSLGTYKVQIPCNTKVKLIAQKENYSEETKNVTTSNKHQKHHNGIDFLLVNYDDLIEKEGDEEKISINSIYFEYDRSEITPQAASELDKVVFTMNKFPKIKIKIESHTDSRGSANYNLRLSQARSSATEAYILQKGISPERILSTTGYGEQRILNICIDNVSCTEDQHQENRRSNFIVVEK